MALGRGSTTVPSTVNASSLGLLRFFLLITSLLGAWEQNTPTRIDLKVVPRGRLTILPEILKSAKTTLISRALAGHVDQKASLNSSGRAKNAVRATSLLCVRARSPGASGSRNFQTSLAIVVSVLTPQFSLGFSVVKIVTR